MEIEILEQQCGGTEFVPRPHRLHLGAQNAEGVDRLQFILPAAWAGCTLALYLRRSDGVQLAAIPLDADDSVTVDRRLTGSVRGQWMLAAIGSGGYTAYTRPGSYDVYATLPTDGGSEELPPSVYEQFVARVPCRRHWRKRLRTKFWQTVPMPRPAQSGRRLPHCGQKAMHPPVGRC